MNYRASETVEAGKRYIGEMPASEVCMAMGVTGRRMQFELLDNDTVQLYRLDGRIFSFPILPGEAGLYPQDEGGYYYHPCEVEHV